MKETTEYWAAFTPANWTIRKRPWWLAGQSKSRIFPMGKLMSLLIRSGTKSNLLELIGREVSSGLLAAFVQAQIETHRPFVWP